MHLQVRVTVPQVRINSPYCLLAPTHTHLCRCGLKHGTAKNYRSHVGTVFRHNGLQTPTPVNGTLLFLHTRSSGVSFEQLHTGTNGPSIQGVPWLERKLLGAEIKSQSTNLAYLKPSIRPPII